MSEQIGENLATKEEIIEAANLVVDADSTTSPELNEIARALLTHPEIDPRDKTQLYNRMVKAWSQSTAKWNPDLRGIDIADLPELDLSLGFI